MNASLRAWLERAWSAPPADPPAGSWFLDLAAHLYGWGLKHQHPRVRRGPIPVVSVGSIWSGGAGKTPLTAELARLADEDGASPAIILRGYGGEVRGGSARVPFPRVDGDARRFGDEACLHARRDRAHVYVAPDRLLGVAAAATDGCRLALLDDGMQHRRLARDLEIVTLPARRPFANGRLLPRGPLREPPGAIARADIVVLAHADRSGAIHEAIDLVREQNRSAEILTWSARIRFRALTGEEPRSGASVGLLSGIARPAAFREAVETAGMHAAFELSFEDHHAFTQREIDGARRRAAASGIGHLVVTEKDEMRLAALDLGDDVAFGVADVELEWRTAGAEDSLRSRLRSLVRL